MDPLTISAGISAVSSLFKGISGFFGGNSQAKADKEAARQAGQESGVAAQDALAQGDQIAAQGAVQAAANGGGFVGSSIAAISNLSRAAMFNARAAAYRGQTEIQSHLYDAKVAKAAGLNDLIGGTLGAAGSLYKGGAQVQANARMLAALRPPAPTQSGETAGLY